MEKPFIVGAVGSGLDGVNGAGRAKGEKIEQGILRLLKAPRPEVVRIAGKAIAPFWWARSSTAQAVESWTSRSVVSDAVICREVSREWPL